MCREESNDLISENRMPKHATDYFYDGIAAPLKDIAILTKPEENLALIMKDGKIYKYAVK